VSVTIITVGMPMDPPDRIIDGYERLRKAMDVIASYPEVSAVLRNDLYSRALGMLCGKLASATIRPDDVPGTRLAELVEEMVAEFEQCAADPARLSWSVDR
jgi:hypothetical protein